MKTLSIITQKGGAGKTTLATGLAVAAELDGKQTALFDLDPQATACFWSDTREADTPAVKDCIPARLPHYLQAAAKAGCDLAIIDCPAVHRDIAHDVAELSDFVLIPTQPDVFDFRSMRATVAVVKQIGTPFAVILNKCPYAGQELRDAREAITAMKAPLCPAELSLLKAFPRAQQSGQSVMETEPESKAARQLEDVYRYTIIQMYQEGAKPNGKGQDEPTSRRA